MRISDHWTRHRITTNYAVLSNLFSQIIQYQNDDQHAKHVAVRICIRPNGTISATVTPQTQAVRSELVELFIHEKQVNWFSTLGSATIRVTKENQSELNRLFSMLVEFDQTLQPIQDDLKTLLHEIENSHTRHSSVRRQRDCTL